MPNVDKAASIIGQAISHAGRAATSNDKPDTHSADQAPHKTDKATKAQREILSDELAGAEVLTTDSKDKNKKRDSSDSSNEHSDTNAHHSDSAKDTIENERRDRIADAYNLWKRNSYYHVITKPDGSMKIDPKYRDRLDGMIDKANRQFEKWKSDFLKQQRALKESMRAIANK